MLKKLTLELCRCRKQCVAALDEDLKRAYDQTERFVKEMSLRRFGVPEGMINWLQEFDRGNQNIVLTAFGDSEPFEAEMGAWAQGDDFSPIGWVVTMDWMIQVVTEASDLPAKVGKSVVDALMYADDASYLQAIGKAVHGILRSRGDIPRCLEAIQKVADATERYCGFTGHQIRVDKSALQLLLWLKVSEHETMLITDKNELSSLMLRQWEKGEAK